jgi:uncharacterized NAD(P)/FAD-binding protein YdhS
MTALPDGGPPGPAVVVVGNGAAGTMVVVGLLRAAGAAGTPLEIIWVGDGPPAHGVAYATTRPWHRLNVPADTVSLDAAHRDFPDSENDQESRSVASDPFPD